MIIDFPHLMRMMERGAIPKHRGDQWVISQVDPDSGETRLLEVSSFAMSQAKQFKSIEVVSTADGYIAVLRKEPLDNDLRDFPVLSSDLTPLSTPDRLKALDATGLWNSSPEETFDSLTHLASMVLKCPVAMLALVSGDQQFTKSFYGSADDRPDSWFEPLSDSLSKFVAANGKELIICETHRHPLVKDMPSAEEHHIRAYAGFPIWSSQGQALGALCVLDHKPREWKNDEVDLLKKLAGIANTCVEASELRRRVAGHAALTEQCKAHLA